MANRVYALVPGQPTVEAPPGWRTGLCECCGQNACCSECCFVAIGLDFCLYKDTDELYVERQHGLKYDSTRKYRPMLVLEEYVGVDCYRAAGVLCTCGLAAATGGIFDLLWCCCLARQRRMVRDMYRIDGNACSDCFVASCCRCCMFNQLKHQLEADNPRYPEDPHAQVNSMQQPMVKYILPPIALEQSRGKKRPPPGNPTNREYL
jgi:hypothetical protein